MPYKGLHETLSSASFIIRHRLGCSLPMNAAGIRSDFLLFQETVVVSRRDSKALWGVSRAYLFLTGRPNISLRADQRSKSSVFTLWYIINKSVKAMKSRSQTQPKRSIMYDKGTVCGMSIIGRISKEVQGVTNNIYRNYISPFSHFRSVNVLAICLKRVFLLFFSFPTNSGL